MMEQFYTSILPLRVGQAACLVWYILCFVCYKISEYDSEKQYMNQIRINIWFRGPQILTFEIVSRMSRPVFKLRHLHLCVSLFTMVCRFVYLKKIGSGKKY